MSEDYVPDSAMAEQSQSIRNLEIFVEKKTLFFIDQMFKNNGYQINGCFERGRAAFCTKRLCGEL